MIRLVAMADMIDHDFKGNQSRREQGGGMEYLAGTDDTGPEK